MPQTPLALTIALFLAAAAGVWFSGSRLVAYADEIADRLRIGRAMMGFVFLAITTSLPEIVTTGIAAGTGEASLALGNLLGGVTLQFAMLAVADGFARGAAITSYPRKSTAALEGVALAFLLAMLFATLILGEGDGLAGIGFGATLLGVFYVGALFILRRHDAADPWMPVQVPEAAEADTEGMFVSSFPDLGTGVLNLRFVLLSAAILASGALAVLMAERLVEQTGMGAGFVGVTLLAAVTSLPELSTTVAAVRIGAYTMAISKIFGSNLLMLGMIWPADILFRDGPILLQFEPVLELSLISGLLATIVYVAGLLLRSRRSIAGFGIDSVIVLAIFAVTLVFYWVRQ